MQHVEKGLDVAPVSFVLVVLFFKALLDLVVGRGGKAGSGSIPFVDIAIVAAKVAIYDGIVDHLDHGVQSEADRPLTVIEDDLVERGLSRRQAGLFQNGRSGGITQKRRVVESVGQ